MVGDMPISAPVARHRPSRDRVFAEDCKRPTQKVLLAEINIFVYFMVTWMTARSIHNATIWAYSVAFYLYQGLKFNNFTILQFSVNAIDIKAFLLSKLL